MLARGCHALPPLDTGRCLQLPPQLRFCVLSTLQRRAGAKGFGLFAAQDLEEGHFIIQYLGEVSSCNGFSVGLLFKPCTFAPAELAPHGEGGGAHCQSAGNTHDGAPVAERVRYRAC